MIIKIAGEPTDVQVWQNVILKRIIDQYNLTIKSVKSSAVYDENSHHKLPLEVTMEFEITNTFSGVDGIPF